MNRDREAIARIIDPEAWARIDGLDEVERLREGHEIVARIWKILGSPTFEELQGDTIFDVIEKRLSCATRAEAHAERLAGALEALTVAADGIKHWHDAMSDNSGMVVSAEHVRALWGERDSARSALSAYRSEKDEACSRPSDALDAPVADQSTTCSQPERTAP